MGGGLGWLFFGFFSGAWEVSGEIDGDEFLLAAEDGTHSLAQSRQARYGAVVGNDRRQLPDQPCVLGQGESHFGVGEGGQGQVVMDVRVLGFFAAQKLSPGGKIKKQLANFQAGPMRAAGFFHFEQFSTVDDYLGGGGGTAFSFASGQGHPANAGNARQGLASKSHGGDGA